MTSQLLRLTRSRFLRLHGALSAAAIAAGLLAGIPLAAQSTNFGSVNVGSSSASPVAVTLTVGTAGTLGSIAVLTQGAPDLDFTNAGGGTCTVNTAYTASETCTVDVTFTPKHPGPRYGGVELLDGSGNLLASGYVWGTGVGPQATFANSTSGAYLPSAQSSLGSGFSEAEGVAVDASGNVFVADPFHNAVKEIVAAGGYTTVKTLGSGFSNPESVAVDGNGNIFVADSFANAVKEIFAAGGYTTINTLGGGFSFPYDTDVAVDGNGNVFVPDPDYGVMREIVAAGGYTTVNTLGSGYELVSAAAVAVDGSGNVFFAGWDDNWVGEMVAADGYSIEALGSGLNYPSGVAVDGDENVFVADGHNGEVKEILAAGGYTTVSILGSGFANAVGVAVDGSGNVFVTDFSRTAYKLDFADPPSLTYAGVGVGAESGPQLVTVSNDGNADLTFAVPAAGDNPSISSGFTLDASTTCPQLHPGSAPAILTMGASCVYAIDFTPAQLGKYSGSLTLSDNSLNAGAPGYAVQSVALSGISTAAPPVGDIASAADSATGSTTVGQSDLVAITGLAADPQDGSPMSNVEVYIDGNAVGTPTLGLSSPDFAATNNNPAYGHARFELLYPAASLAPGSHKVTAIATDSYGVSSTFGPVYFTVSASAGMPTGGIESAVDSATGSTTVGLSDLVVISGWAADPHDGSPMSNVKVYIDGNAVGTPTLGLVSPTFAAEYNNPAYGHARFELLYPAASLAPGSHKVTAIAINSQAVSSTFGPVSFTVVAGTGMPTGGIESAVDNTTGSTTVGAGDSVVIAGWAADPHDGSPMSNVRVYIDGNAVGTPTLGLVSPTFAAEYNNPAYGHARFVLVYPAAGLSVGAHTVTVVAIDSLALSATLGPVTFTVQ
jgi:hypothetical protein